ncbi:MAG: signal peptide peptidase SppA, partial [Nannocystaceae bacterium]
GMEVELARVGFATGLVAGSGSGSVFHGASGKIRVSGEDYPQAYPNKREVALLDLGDYRGDRGMYRLVRKLDEYAQKPGTVVLDTSEMSFKWAQIEEIREAIGRVREAGGRVAVYLRGGSLRSYFLATSGEQIWAHPRSRLSTLGLYSSVFYYGELLAKLGAKAEFVRIAEYKGRPEQFSRTGPSEPAGRQRRQVASDIFNHITRLVGRDRHLAPEDVVAQLIDRAPHTPTQAQALRMVDGLYERDSLEQAAEAWLARPVKLQAPSSRPEHRASFGPGPEVAIVYVEGVMVTGTSVSIPLVGQKLLGDRTIVPVLERLRKDRNVKAVVVRIDSVGGSVACADNIARELDRVRAVKPVVISMGSVAASGGYYVATGGQYIVADATTRTGSIGIFLPKVDLSGVLKKFGVAASHFGLGKRAGMHSWFHPYTDDERQAAQAGIQASYDVFTARVARARRLTEAQVDGLARGRVWSGVRATENGLVDRYGGLREAVMVAQQLAKLRPTGFDVREYPPAPGLVEQIQALFGLELPIPLRATLAGTPAAEGLVLGGQYGPILAILSRLPASLWLGSPEPMALESAVFVLR